MKQSLVFFIWLLSLSSSLISPIHARNKPHHEMSPSPSPSSSPAPGPSLNSKCSEVNLKMMDCLTYLTPGSNETRPNKPCCDSIKSVIEFNPQCICEGLKTAKQMDVELNNTRALDTHKACKLSVAPPHCSGQISSAATPSASTPISASTPSMSPVSPSNETPMTSPSPSKSPETSPSSSQSPAPSPFSSQSPETSPPLAESPENSPSSDDSPATMTTPSPPSSATNKLSIPTMALVAALVSSIAYF